MIRPFIFADEGDIRYFIKQNALPVVRSTCPEDKHTEREYMKEYLRTFDRKHRGLYRRIAGAMERGQVDGWKE